MGRQTAARVIRHDGCVKPKVNEPGESTPNLLSVISVEAFRLQSVNGKFKIAIYMEGSTDSPGMGNCVRDVKEPRWAIW